MAARNMAASECKVGRKGNKESRKKVFVRVPKPRSSKRFVRW